jgi:hypothetical protein
MVPERQLPPNLSTKLSELKVYAVPQSVYDRDYGSPDEIVLAGNEQKQAS